MGRQAVPRRAPAATRRASWGAGARVGTRKGGEGTGPPPPAGEVKRPTAGGGDHAEQRRCGGRDRRRRRPGTAAAARRRRPVAPSRCATSRAGVPPSSRAPRRARRGRRRRLAVEEVPPPSVVAGGGSGVCSPRGSGRGGRAGGYAGAAARRVMAAQPQAPRLLPAASCRTCRPDHSVGTPASGLSPRRVSGSTATGSSARGTPPRQPRRRGVCGRKRADRGGGQAVRPGQTGPATAHRPTAGAPCAPHPVERRRTRVGRSGGKGGGGWSATTLCRGRRRGRREGGRRAALVAHTPPLPRGRGRTPKPFSWRGGSGCVGTRRRRARRPLGVAGAEERLVWRGVWAGRPGGTGSTGRPPREAAWCNRSFIGSGGGAGKVAGAMARRRRGGLESGSGAVTDDKRPAGCPPSYTPHAVRRRAKGMTAGAHGGARVCSLAAGRPSICNGRERRQGGGRTVVGRAPCRPREGAAARARPLGRVRCSSADRTGGCQPTWPSGLMGSAD